MTKAITYPLLTLAIISLLSCTPSEITTKQYDLVVLGGRVIDSDSGLDAVRNIGVRDERIPKQDSTPFATLEFKATRS